jgi:hypothetical protein
MIAVVAKRDRTRIDDSKLECLRSSAVNLLLTAEVDGTTAVSGSREATPHWNAGRGFTNGLPAGTLIALSTCAHRRR